MFVGSSKKENGWHWKAGRGGGERREGERPRTETL